MPCTPWRLSFINIVSVRLPPVSVTVSIRKFDNMIPDKFPEGNKYLLLGKSTEDPVSWSLLTFAFYLTPISLFIRSFLTSPFFPHLRTCEFLISGMLFPLVSHVLHPQPHVLHTHPPHPLPPLTLFLPASYPRHLLKHQHPRENVAAFLGLKQRNGHS